MADFKSKAQLLDDVERGYEEWASLLKRIPPDQMTRPGVTGDWSVKDIVAHVNFYEDYMASRLESAARGEAPTPTDVTGLETAEANDIIYRKNLDRPLDEILAEFPHSHDRLLSGIQALPEEDLNDPTRFPWTRGDALWEWIPGNSYEHYKEHIPLIQAWLAGLKQTEPTLQ